MSMPSTRTTSETSMNAIATADGGDKAAAPPKRKNTPPASLSKIARLAAQEQSAQAQSNSAANSSQKATGSPSQEALASKAAFFMRTLSSSSVNSNALMAEPTPYLRMVAQHTASAGGSAEQPTSAAGAGNVLEQCWLPNRCPPPRVSVVCCLLRTAVAVEHKKFMCAKRDRLINFSHSGSHCSTTLYLKFRHGTKSSRVDTGFWRNTTCYHIITFHFKTVCQQLKIYLKPISTIPQLTRTMGGPIKTDHNFNTPSLSSQSCPYAIKRGGIVARAVASASEIKDPLCDPDSPRVIHFEEISAAAYKIKSGIAHTSLTRSNQLSEMLEMDLYFKNEFMQFTGSFKERGARYALMKLEKEQRAAGVIAASAGNHALALSYHGKSLGIPVTVVMPVVAPLMKISSCRAFGATIIIEGGHLGESKQVAMRLAVEHGYRYINGYDHPDILAGAGTVALEVLNQLDDIDAIVAPIGGGGLISGMAVATKYLQPGIQIIGVEPKTVPSMTDALAAGKPVRSTVGSTLADGLAVSQVGVNAFASCKELLTRVVTVEERYIALSVLRLIEVEKAVVEGGGAAPLAALLAGYLPELKGKRVVIPLTGGNIDTTALGRAIERGLAVDNRLCRFSVVVSDRPGGIAELAALCAAKGVSIKDTFHERAWTSTDIFSVRVKVIVETNDKAHCDELEAALRENYSDVIFNEKTC